MEKTRKMVRVLSGCVACGCCVEACPLRAISVWHEIRAQINSLRCVGCGECVLVCPAAMIVITEKEETYEETKAVV